VKVLNAEFVTSVAADAAGIPQDGPAHIALAGRSNVGKSSLINALCRRTIARTSAAPGKTRLANIYRVEVQSEGRRRVYLVDLPGYGYARGGRDGVKELAAVAEAYFESRSDSGPRTADGGPRTADRGMTLLIVDSRHPGMDADRHAFEWLTRMGAVPAVVASKVDKLSRAERTRNLRDIERTFGVPALPVSSTTGEGLDELWKLIVRRAGL
jgi:GTP-binding protein